MTIISVIHSFRYADGGTTTAVLEISRILRVLGLETVVITCASDVREPGLRVVEVEYSVLRRFSFSAAAADAVREFAADDAFVIMHGLWAGIYHQVASACVQTGIRYAVISHGSLDPFDLQKKKLAKRVLGPLFVRKLLDGAAGLICSTPMEARVLETYGSTTERRVVPWPVSREPNAVIPTRNEGRAAFEIERDAFVILFLSRINYKKGLERLIDGCELAGERIAGLRLLIAGTGDAAYEAQIKARAEECRKVTIEFTCLLGGRKKELALAASDGFALISDNENFGFSIPEALAAGLPCLISDQVYMWEQLVSGGATLVCDRNSEGVFHGVLQLRDRIAKDGATEISRLARLTADQFLPEALVGKYREFLADLGLLSGVEEETG